MTRLKGCVLLLAVFLVWSSIQHSHADEPKGSPVLWKSPGQISTLDLYWGPGSSSDAPQPPFRFVKEDTGGTKPKVQIVDSRDITWNVKFAGASANDNEVHAEIAASRLMWALGYPVEHNYFVPEGKLDGAAGLKRAAA